LPDVQFLAPFSMAVCALQYPAPASVGSEFVVENVMRELRNDFWHNLRNDVAAGPQWRDRAVVLTYAVITGLIVVAFTLLAEAASRGFEHVLHFGAIGPWLPLLWTPGITVAVLWWTRRFAPGAQGSGIPQVVAALDDALPETERLRLVSLRLSVEKVLLVSGGVLAGLSIGREGPTVQVGAGVMLHARRWLSPHSGIDAHDLIVAGAAAGIAAAFNTPLGGVIFALEQLSRRRSFSHSGLVIISIVLAGLVAVSSFGNLSYFGELRAQQPNWPLLGPGLLVALATGLAGGLFSRLIVVSTRGLPDRFSQWRTRYPLRFAAVCGLAVAIIGLVSGGETVGAGYAQTRGLLEGHGDLPATYTWLKFCATWLSAWSGVPAGVFAPSLAIGAGIGRDVAWLTGFRADAGIPMVALGMVGFLAATTQGPLTAFIIVMEMVSGHSMVLSLMATAFLASGVARWITPPMYVELAALLAPPIPRSSPPDWEAR
jgi:H+/Cl- antiporter ClcA